jgi:hypothetical protein
MGSGNFLFPNNERLPKITDFEYTPPAETKGSG